MTTLESRFGFHSTAAEVVDGVDLSGRRAVVTGGASGIGRETARSLAAAGASVTIAVRDVRAGREAATNIAPDGHGGVEVARLDLADLEDVTRFVDSWEGPLHVLVNNAGVMAVQELTRSAAGHELQLATNHLGHFALARGLHPALAAAGSARVVAVSSSGHLRSPVVFDDVDFRFRDYEPFAAYGQSKTANILFAVEADRRWRADGIRVNALHPGGIATRLQRHVGGAAYMERAGTAFRRAGSEIKTVEQGAATSAYLAASPEVEDVGGHYFEDCRPARLVTQRDLTRVGGVAPYALDPGNAARMWELSEEMVAPG